MSKRPLAVVLPPLFVCAIVDAWAGRRSYVAGDTVTYMDMASGIAAGNFDFAVNGHFSPLYPAILALFMRVFPSSALAEFWIVRGVNLLVFVSALALFHVFMIRFLERCERHAASSPDALQAMPRFHFLIIGYIQFAWACFYLTFVSRVNPDICVAACTFAAAALLLRFDTDQRPLEFAAFGAILGIGYLFKAIFFPIAFLFLIAAALEPRVRQVKSRLLLSLTVFLLIASPLVVALSVKYGHLTFGESGKLSYWWEVLKQNPGYVHWQGEPSGSGIPAHPTRKILQHPDVYEFATPFLATYSPWFAPTYWNAGASVQLDLGKQVLSLARNLRRLVVVYWLAVPVLLVSAVSYRRTRISPRAIRALAPLWFVATGNLAIYLLINVDGRYLAGCLPILGVVALGSVRYRTADAARTLGVTVIAVCALATGVAIGPRLAEAAAVVVRTRGDVRDDRWLVAQEFSRLGVAPGTPVAAIDYQSLREHWSAAVISDWARLAHVRVVGEVTQPEDDAVSFWHLSGDRQLAALSALRSTGARFVVASGVPALADTTGWTRIARSQYYYRSLE